MSDASQLELIAGRRMVTVLFADICGFTTLSERLDSEEVYEIINYLFEALTEEVHRFNGHVDKYIGDCLMAIFGAGRSDGDDAEHAVAAALRMQKRIGEMRHPRCEELGIDLAIRVGVNSGLVYAGFVGGAS